MGGFAGILHGIHHLLAADAQVDVGDLQGVCIEVMAQWFRVVLGVERGAGALQGHRGVIQLQLLQVLAQVCLEFLVFQELREGEAQVESQDQEVFLALMDYQA